MAPWSFLGKLIGIIGSGRFFEEMYHWIQPASVFGAGGPSFNSEKSMVPEITCQMGSQEVNRGRKRSKNVTINTKGQVRVGYYGQRWRSIRVTRGQIRSNPVGSDDIQRGHKRLNTAKGQIRIPTVKLKFPGKAFLKTLFIFFTIFPTAAARR